MQLVDLANFSQNAPKMESTNLCSVRTAFVGVLISTEMNFMELRFMEVGNLAAQINQNQVFVSPSNTCEHQVQCIFQWFKT